MRPFGSFILPACGVKCSVGRSRPVIAACAEWPGADQGTAHAAWSGTSTWLWRCRRCVRTGRGGARGRDVRISEVRGAERQRRRRRFLGQPVLEGPGSARVVLQARAALAGVVVVIVY